MKINLKRILSILLVICLCMGTLPAFASAEESDPIPGVVEETVNNPDGTTSAIKTTTTTEVDEETGKKTVTIVVEEVVTDENGNEIRKSEEGSQISTETKEPAPGDKLPEVEVELKPSQTTTGTAADSDSASDSDNDTDKTDGEWDYTTTTTETQREVEVTTGEIEVTKNEVSDTGLQGVGPELYEGKKDVTNAGVDGTPAGSVINHFHKYETTDENGEPITVYYPIVARTKEEFDLLPDEIKENYHAPVSEGDLYVPKDTENAWSETDDDVFWDAVLGQIPESPFNGDVNLEFKNTDSNAIVPKNKGVSMIALYDKAGNIVYTYCMDANTNANIGNMYTVENLEDADFIAGTPEEVAAAKDHIRATVENGYWGTKEGTGSLDLLKENLRAFLNDPAAENFVLNFEARVDNVQNKLPVTYDSEVDRDTLLAMIDDITEGEALLATQVAVWMYGHKPLNNSTANVLDDFELNTYKSFTPTGGTNQNVYTDNDAHKDGEARMELIVAYLISDYLVAKSKNDDKGSVIIDEKNFVSEDGLKLTVGDKISDGVAENGVTEQDTYNTSLSFQMVVTPTSKDDLIVTLLDAEGKPIRQGFIGKNEANNDENEFVIEGGVYTFKNVELKENSEVCFDLKLEGVQYLDRGVYVYKSTAGYDAEQTCVGLSEGNKSVDVEANFTLEFNVDETQNITVEHHWGSYEEKQSAPDYPPQDPDDPTPPVNPPMNPPIVIPPEITPLTDIPDDETPLTEIPDEEPPLANVPKTGDGSAVWFVLAALLAVALSAVIVIEKKRQTV